MTRHHFAGLNTTRFADVLAGRPVLISYADIVRRPGVWAREILPRLREGAYHRPILDSGAFTELTTPGFSVSISEYAAFVNAYGAQFDQVVTLDSIRGDLERTWINTERLLDTGRSIIPVFHGREPVEVFHHYCQEFDRVGLGFARVSGRISKDQGGGDNAITWLRRMLVIASRYDVEVHGFGMSRYARAKMLDTQTLTSTDSTTWIAEYRALLCREGNTHHGVRGAIAQHLDSLGRREIAELVVRSYTTPPPAFSLRPHFLASDSWGQARTVLTRFTPDALSSVMMRLREQSDQTNR